MKTADRQDEIAGFHAVAARLTALNAQFEAARAGEEGAEFFTHVEFARQALLTSFRKRPKKPEG
ncbi:MAG: hypothetical protein DRH56_01745 [Deltaproteobacteria bacterium]|nr:MAG: hypothetical protein DRH56_01745 [Deltaproteobacteria bacterium]